MLWEHALLLVQHAFVLGEHAFVHQLHARGASLDTPALINQPRAQIDQRTLTHTDRLDPTLSNPNR